MAARRVRDRVVAVALPAYLLVLVLAAVGYAPLPGPLRTLAEPSRLAREGLFRVGIVPGLALFRDPTDTAISVRSNCVEVVALRPGRPPQTVFRTDQSCAPPSAQAFIPVEEMAVTRLLYDAMAYYQTPLPGRGTLGDRYLLALGDFFCQRESGSQRIVVRWAQRLFHTDTGAAGDFPRVRFSYACGSDSVHAAWHPDIEHPVLMP